MPRDLFGDVVRPFNGAGARSRYTVPLSLAAHTLIVVSVVVVPLLATDALPALSSRMIFESVTPIVPPEPPRPRVVQPVDTRVDVSPDAAPIDAPDSIAPETGWEGVSCGEPGALARCNGGLSATDSLGVNDFSEVAPPPPPPAPKQEPRTARAGVEVRPPTKIRDAAPVYPAIAQSARISGVVIIQATIGVDGAVIDATVLRSVPLLDQAALEAVRQWRYTPSSLNGQPVAVVMTVTVNFQLR